jgi:DNA-binding NarL/FixJ family response regulator
MAFISNPNNYNDVNHKNGIRTDNCVENLEWVSRSYNISHSYNVLNRKKTIGQNCSSAKLTEKQVLEIVSLIKKGVPVKEIAEIMSTPLRSIYSIKTGNSWSWLTKDLMQYNKIKRVRLKRL